MIYLLGRRNPRTGFWETIWSHMSHCKGWIVIKKQEVN